MKIGPLSQRWLAERRPALVAMLEQLVLTESHAAQPAGVAEAASLVIEQLSSLGFSFTEIPQSPLPQALHWLEDLMSPGVPYSNLGATYSGFRRGERPGRLLLVGDLDTAFPPGSPTGGFRIEGAKAFGPGVADMKGGLVVMVAALGALCHLGAGLPDIAVVLSGDEQAGSLGSRPTVERAGMGADWCLGLECARQGGKLMSGRGHIGVGRLTVRGRESHTGSAHAQGRNALDGLARLIVGFNRLTNEEQGTYITVTMAQAGRRRSVTPAHASAVVDIRTRGPDYWDAVVRRMHSLVPNVEEDCGVTVELLTHNHRPGVQPNERTEILLSIAEKVGEDLSIKIDAFESAAAGSVSFRSPSTATLDGLGPVGGDLMTRNEHVQVDSLVSRAALLAGIISQLPPARSQ
ncbi:MAG: M20/M25/M40 family metallo-hydrolase [bacterium]|nr:M20/M25/M40 family metallo-hydrolase [Acidimicrobiia bacterium]MCY4650366.1 M20/M25/M40 family metallo-hydrolase [bacterium]